MQDLEGLNLIFFGFPLLSPSHPPSNSILIKFCIFWNFNNLLDRLSIFVEHGLVNARSKLVVDELCWVLSLWLELEVLVSEHLSFGLHVDKVGLGVLDVQPSLVFLHTHLIDSYFQVSYRFQQVVDTEFLIELFHAFDVHVGKPVTLFPASAASELEPLDISEA